jgi:hypothetical protein
MEASTLSQRADVRLTASAPGRTGLRLHRWGFALLQGKGFVQDRTEHVPPRLPVREVLFRDVPAVRSVRLIRRAGPIQLLLLRRRPEVRVL